MDNYLPLKLYTRALHFLNPIKVFLLKRVFFSINTKFPELNKENYRIKYYF